MMTDTKPDATAAVLVLRLRTPTPTGPVKSCPTCRTALDGGPIVFDCPTCKRCVHAADIDVEYHAPNAGSAAA